MSVNPCDRMSALNLIADSAERRGAILSQQLNRCCLGIMGANGIKYVDHSPEARKTAMLNCGKDIEKMAIFQGDDVDPFKLFGYMGFWVRKIKPFSKAFDHNNKVVIDINERFSLWLIRDATLLYLEKKKVDKIDPNSAGMQFTQEQIDKCSARFDAFFNNEERFLYVLHCMQNRTYGPHHFVVLIQNMVYGA